jgi:AcrR family transcriptional regulator
MVSSPIPSRRREQGARTRDRVLEVATDLMARHGYSGTSISAISKASGVMPASIYWHFESKEGLLAAVIERAADAWFAGVTEAMAEADAAEAAGAPPFGALSFVFQEQPEFYRVLLLISLERREDDAATREVVHRIRERCRSLMAHRLDDSVPLEDAGLRRQVCERLTDFGMVLFDGSFLAQQIDPADPQTLVRSFEQIAWGMNLAKQALMEEVTARVAGGEEAAG